MDKSYVTPGRENTKAELSTYCDEIFDIVKHKR